MRALVLRKSFSDRLASKQLAALMFQKTPIRNLSVDYIIPIPLHWTRYARRGFNQSREMAFELSERLNAPVLNLIKRKKRTQFQSKLTRDLRQENLKDVFVIRKIYQKKFKDLTEGKKVLFVDDLCTTGATLKSVARLISKGEPKTMQAVVACRVQSLSRNL